MKRLLLLVLLVSIFAQNAQAKVIQHIQPGDCISLRIQITRETQFKIYQAQRMQYKAAAYQDAELMFKFKHQAEDALVWQSQFWDEMESKSDCHR